MLGPAGINEIAAAQSQCSAVQCSAVQCSAVQCMSGGMIILVAGSTTFSTFSGRAHRLNISVGLCQYCVERQPVHTVTVQCSAVQCSAVQCSAVQCSAVYRVG
jgi:hypothetical protein